MRAAPHPFTLRQLQYAVAIAEELSFRRAAARCRVSQPSLSAQVAQLEDVLGARLFERDRRKVLVTAAGQELVERARRLLVDADALLDAGKRASDPFTGTLRIGVIPTIAPYYLPLAAPKLRAKFPRLAFVWHEDRTRSLLAALEAGELDAAIVALEADLGDVERQPLGDDPFVLAVGSKHPLARSSAVVESVDLRGAEILLLEDGHCFREQALEVCSTARVHEGEFRATSLTTLVQMVAGGVGVTLLPSLAVPTEVKRAGLHVRPMASPRAQRTIALVNRKRSPLGPALKEIARVLHQSFPEPRKASR